MFNMLILLLLCVVCLCVNSVSGNVTVVTKKGTIVGSTNDGYNTFFGVPYAKVDEDNPFGSYLDYPNFQNPFIANDSSIICPQANTKVGVLQCLRLNIYVPHTAKENHTVPVLVWFHGGGFLYGSANDYGCQHLTKQDIVVVTVNYRLGVYGFLCLNDESVPGNQGLKDQIGALRWVKENIKAFGGDPDKVTIAGESYGGGAVDLHLYSKYETLFDKVIIESGSIYTPGFYVKGDEQAAVKLATHLGHQGLTTKEALAVLAKEDPVAVIVAVRNLSMRLTPCNETGFTGGQSFVNECINHLTNPDRVKNISIMIGYNSIEGFGSFSNRQQDYDSLQDMFYQDLKSIYVLTDSELEKLSDIVRTFYLGSKKIGPESMLELCDYSSDTKMNYAVEKSVSKYIEQGGNVYKYMFSYIGGSEYQNVTGAGAPHTEELKYLFESYLFNFTSEEQRMMRDRMTTMWANFVKLGNPTPEKTELLPVTWVPVTGTARPYLNIDVTMSIKDHAYRQRMAFWELFMQKYDLKSSCKNLSSANRPIIVFVFFSICLFYFVFNLY